MTPQEYLANHKPLFALIRFALFHSIPMLNDARTKHEQAFRKAPTWALAIAASMRGGYGEKNEARSNIETLAFRALNEFNRRTRRAEMEKAG